MNHLSYLFRGFIQTQIDQDYGVVILEIWNASLSGDLCLRLGDESGMCRIQILPKSVMKRLELKALPTVGAATSFHNSPQYKLFLPKDYCQSVSIIAPGHVVQTGKGHYIEVWSKDHFDLLLQDVVSGAD